MGDDHASLTEFMSCEKLDRDLFRGQSKDLNTGQVYGGQVLGQAIQAAMHTVDADRPIRSAHAYFLRKGDVTAPIIYEVDRSLDGRSTSSRRVVAIQHGKQILHLSSSFQKEEKGLDYIQTLDVPIASLEQYLANEDFSTNHFQEQFLDIHPLKEEERTRDNSIQLWIKTKENLPDDPRTHQSAMAYISDLGLLHSTLVPHGYEHKTRSKKSPVILASIDHVIWFHRPFRVDEWFFYDCRVISTSGGRGLADGRLYDKSGTLVASTAQEGMLRLRR